MLNIHNRSTKLYELWHRQNFYAYRHVYTSRCACVCVCVQVGAFFQPTDCSLPSEKSPEGRAAQIKQQERTAGCFSFHVPDI